METIAHTNWLNDFLPPKIPADLTQKEVQAIYDAYSDLGKAIRNYLEPWFVEFPVKHGKEWRAAVDAGDWKKEDELTDSVRPAISIEITPDILAGWGDTPGGNWSWHGDWESSSAFC